jgi:hypothetical protein
MQSKEFDRFYQLLRLGPLLPPNRLSEMAVEKSFPSKADILEYVEP